KTLLIAMGVSFLIQHLGENLINFDSYTNWLELSRSNLGSGLVYTLVSYAFLHADIFHIGINGFILYMAGRSLTGRLSNKDIYTLFFGTVLIGAFCFLLVKLVNPYGAAIGASAAVLGFLSMVLMLRY